MYQSKSRIFLAFNKDLTISLTVHVSYELRFLSHSFVESFAVALLFGHRQPKHIIWMLSQRNGLLGLYGKHEMQRKLANPSSQRGKINNINLLLLHLVSLCRFEAFWARIGANCKGHYKRMTREQISKLAQNASNRHKDTRISRFFSAFHVSLMWVFGFFLRNPLLLILL